MIDTKSQKLLEFLKEISLKESPLNLDLFLRKHNLSKDFLLGVLPFLKFFNVIVETQQQEIYAQSDIALYFIKSLIIYIENDAKLIDSWERVQFDNNNYYQNLKSFGIYLLKLMEDKRVNNLGIKDAIKTDNLSLIIIKSKLENSDEPHYLYQYNIAIKKFQTLGGYIENPETPEAAANRHLKEELELHDFDKMPTDLKRIDGVFHKFGHSVRNGVFTEYKMDLFLAKFPGSLKLTSLDRWLKYSEIEKGITDDGVEVLTLPSTDQDGPTYLKYLDLSFLTPQVNLSTQIPINQHKDINFTTIIDKYLKADESVEVEFKSSARWDYRESKINKELEKVIVKTIAAFMNSKGGILVIGVSDQKEILGLDNDIQTLNKKSEDGYIQFIINLISTYIGTEYTSFLNVVIEKPEDKLICLVTISQSPKPVFVKNNESRDFYIRVANTSRSLNSEEAYRYIQMKW